MNEVTTTQNISPTQGKSLKPIETVKNSLDHMRPQFQAALPSHISVDKFQRVVMTALNQNPELLNKNRQSLFLACTKAANDGLLPDGKQAALVPYKDEVQYQPMVAGILMKVRNSGELSSLTAQLVHEKDDFKFNPAMDEVPHHNPDWFGNRGKIVGVYAVAKLKDGSYVVEIMSISQVEEVRKRSRATSGPWFTDYGEMVRKTVLKRIAKYLPQSTDKEGLAILENEDPFIDDNDDTLPPPPHVVAEISEEKPKRGRPQKLAAQIEQQQQQSVHPTVQEVIPEPEYTDATPIEHDPETGKIWQDGDVI